MASNTAVSTPVSVARRGSRSFIHRMRSSFHWDTLIYRDPETFEYKPLLATSWKWVDDVTLDFELRRGVKFHNGEKFDADDVVYTLNWISNPANGVKNQQNVSWIEAASKRGEYEVRVHLKKPFPAALEFLSGPVAIYPNEYCTKVGPDGMDKQPVGTGPYRVAKVLAGKEIRFEANRDYYDGSPHFMKYAALRDKGRADGTALVHVTWGSYSINDVSAITSYFFKFMLGGSVVIETVFALHGVGFLAGESIRRADFATVQAIVLILALFYIILTLLADILNGFLDPRIRVA